MAERERADIAVIGAGPSGMAAAMRAACEAGRDAFLAGRIPRKRYATASSPEDGRIGGTVT